MNKLRTWILCGVTACLVTILFSCNPTLQNSPTGSSPSPTPAPVPTATPQPPAKITEILQQPVTVRPTSASQDTPAQEGMGLQAGDTIRTQGEAMAEVTLSNGLGFRISRNAALTIQPDNRLNLTSGDMITWVEPGKTVPAQIVTPTVVAGIRGTTVFVNIPTDPQAETTVFSWEGSVAVRLPGQTEELLLKTGEEVGVRRGERSLAAVRQRIRRFSPQEYSQRRREAVLLRRFKRTLPTLKIIDQATPGQVIKPINPKKVSAKVKQSIEKRSLSPTKLKPKIVKAAVVKQRQEIRRLKQPPVPPKLKPPVPPKLKPPVPPKLKPPVPPN